MVVKSNSMCALRNRVMVLLWWTQVNCSCRADRLSDCTLPNSIHIHLLKNCSYPFKMSEFKERDTLENLLEFSHSPNNKIQNDLQENLKTIIPTIQFDAKYHFLARFERYNFDDFTYTIQQYTTPLIWIFFNIHFLSIVLSSKKGPRSNPSPLLSKESQEIHRGNLRILINIFKLFVENGATVKGGKSKGYMFTRQFPWKSILLAIGQPKIKPSFVSFRNWGEKEYNIAGTRWYLMYTPWRCVDRTMYPRQSSHRTLCTVHKQKRGRSTLAGQLHKQFTCGPYIHTVQFCTVHNSAISRARKRAIQCDDQQFFQFTSNPLFQS